MSMPNFRQKVSHSDAADDNTCGESSTAENWKWNCKRFLCYSFHFAVKCENANVANVIYIISVMDSSIQI